MLTGDRNGESHARARGNFVHDQRYEPQTSQPGGAAQHATQRKILSTFEVHNAFPLVARQRSLQARP